MVKSWKHCFSFFVCAFAFVPAVHEVKLDGNIKWEYTIAHMLLTKYTWHSAVLLKTLLTSHMLHVTCYVTYNIQHTIHSIQTFSRALETLQDTTAIRQQVHGKLYIVFHLTRVGATLKSHVIVINIRSCNNCD